MILTRASLAEHVRVTKSGCWVWRHARMGEGYGILKAAGAVLYAHRVVFELFHGRIPKGGLVCHSCDTPACVNPAHLSAGTASSNLRDSWAHGARAALRRAAA